MMNPEPAYDDWRHRAACKGMDTNVFFPKAGDNVRRVKAICNSCPVEVQCLQWALDHYENNGIWGGLGCKQRRKILRGEPLTVHGNKGYDEGCRCNTCRSAHTERAKQYRERRLAEWSDVDA